MSTVVAIVGSGLLADQVYRELSDQYQVVRQIDFEEKEIETADLALVLHDSWEPAIYQEAEQVLQSAGIPWLRGFVSFGLGIVGPMVRPGIPGCSQCAELRRLMAEHDRMDMWQLRQTIIEQKISLYDPWASRTGLLQVAHVLVNEVKTVLQGSEPRTQGQMFMINMTTLNCSYHFFLPNPECAVCGRLPEDSATAAVIALQPSMKIHADSFRCRSMNELDKVLLEDYLDYQTGLFNGKMYDLASPFADASVNLPLINGDEGTAGRTHSYGESVLTAVLEGLERHCGIKPRGKRTVIHDSYNNLKDQALLNPLTVGLHAKEEYERPGFAFQAFDPDRPMDWVWGYSLVQERPILVPQLLAYYSLGCGHGFVYETSNGCALGGSLEEAILYAIMEVVERDSFLLTWYAKLPLPRIDLASINDKEITLMLDRLQVVAGYDVLLFNSTMEHGIPSVWSIAKNRNGKGVNLICAAGAHLDPIRAVKSSIHELAGMINMLEDTFEANREKSMRMLHDSSLVQSMEDHSTLYSLPQAQDRLQFLLDDSREPRRFDEEFKKKDFHPDLTVDLLGIIEQFRRLNLDVIVVNQTAPEIMRNGLHCVKVLIPGMLPMTFGHHLTRVVGLNRVLRVPVELGYANEPLTLEQLNPYPHPFP